MSLSVISPIETVKTVRTNNASLIVCVTFVAHVDKEPLVFVHGHRAEYIHQARYLCIITTLYAIVKVKTIEADVRIVSLLEKVEHGLGNLDLILLILSTKQIKYVDSTVFSKKLVKVRIERQLVLALAILEAHFGLLLRLLCPEKGHRPSDLQM